MNPTMQPIVLAVFCTGLGTIIYLICTRNKVPSYFGVSFSFITPMAVVTAVDGISGALCGRRKDWSPSSGGRYARLRAPTQWER